MKKTKRMNCPECFEPSAFSTPPLRTERCPDCGYDPGAGLSDAGWQIAIDTWHRCHKAPVKIAHPAYVNDDGEHVPSRHEEVKFTWEHARTWSRFEQGGSDEEGADLIPADQVKASLTPHRRTLVEAIEDIGQRIEDGTCDAELEVTVYLPALELGEDDGYSAAAEIRRQLDELGLTRLELRASDDPAANRLAERLLDAYRGSIEWGIHEVRQTKVPLSVGDIKAPAALIADELPKIAELRPPRLAKSATLELGTAEPDPDTTEKP